MFANFLSIVSGTCTESENIENGPSQVPNVCPWVQSAWLLQPLLHGITVRGIYSSSYTQRVQNCFARVITRAGRFAPSSALHHSLHWSPISFRIKFKVLTLTCKTLSSGKPSYLANCIHLAAPSRSLQFNKGLLLSAPNCNTKTGTRDFSVCAPSFWNKLPPCIRSSESLTCFRQCLKTHLFWLGVSSIWLADFLISW